MNKLVVIDSGNVMHKAIFAYIAQYKSEIKKIMDSKDCTEEEADNILDKKVKRREVFLLNPISTYLRMIIGYLKKIGVTLEDTVIVAEDYGSWRKDIDKNYKAQRADYRESKMEKSKWNTLYKKFNDFISQLDECLPWHFIKLYKLEADDIASAAIRHLDNYEEKILITSDEDWEMLCALPNVKMFSPYTKKFKITKNPAGILAKKIKGDISDNLKEEPKTEAEWDKRKLIVDLLHLPLFVEQIVKPVLETLPMKNLYIKKIPNKKCREEMQKLYKEE